MRSALLLAALETSVNLSIWAVDAYFWDDKLAAVVIHGVTSVGIALGVVSNSRKNVTESEAAPLITGNGDDKPTT